MRPGGSSIENAAILHRSGVQVAILARSRAASTSAASSAATSCTCRSRPASPCAAGCPEEAALEAITHRPGAHPRRRPPRRHARGRQGLRPDRHRRRRPALRDLRAVRRRRRQAGLRQGEELYFAHIRPRADGRGRPRSERVDPGEEPPEEEADARPTSAEDGDEDQEGGTSAEPAREPSAASFVAPDAPVG